MLNGCVESRLLIADNSDMLDVANVFILKYCRSLSVRLNGDKSCRYCRDCRYG